jgi:primase-polymerase (primpol)-like protein
MNKFDSIPEEMKELKQWVLWKFEMRVNGEKLTKVPYQLSGQKADPTNKLQKRFESVAECARQV